MIKRWKIFLLILLIVVIAYAILIDNYPILLPLGILIGLYLVFGYCYLGCPEFGWFTFGKKTPPWYGMVIISDNKINDHCTNCGLSFLK